MGNDESRPQEKSIQPSPSSIAKPGLSLEPVPSQNTTSSDASLPSVQRLVISRLSSAKLRFKTSPISQRRRSGILIVQNTITGKYISSRICEIAARFYKQNIESLSVAERLEIGCSIFFSMTTSDTETKEIMKSNMEYTNKGIEETSLKCLEMMGWLLRHLVTNNVDLYTLLTKLGALHKAMGIKIHHFPSMLKAMHETFSYYFPTKYNIDVRYALDEIFSLTAQIMSGQELKASKYFMEISKQFDTEYIPFLKNISACLESSIGREYFFIFLTQNMCGEIAIFLNSLLRFKTLTSNRERFIAARSINKMSIEPKAVFCLNLSYQTRQDVTEQMTELEQNFAMKDKVVIDKEFFAEVEYETNKLMINQWLSFVAEIKVLRIKSLEM